MRPGQSRRLISLPCLKNLPYFTMVSFRSHCNSKTMIRNLLLLPFICLCITGYSQTNTHFTNPAILDVLKGDYFPPDYAATVVINDPYEISGGLLERINPDSLKATLLELQKFEDRNTGADTLSAVRGMGAARAWVL